MAIPLNALSTKLRGGHAGASEDRNQTGGLSPYAKKGFSPAVWSVTSTTSTISGT